MHTNEILIDEWSNEKKKQKITLSTPNKCLKHIQIFIDFVFYSCVYINSSLALSD